MPDAPLGGVDSASSSRPAPAPVYAALVAAVLGAGAGVCALLLSGWTRVFVVGETPVVLPWGSLLAGVLVFCLATSAGLWLQRRWVPGLVGVAAFAVMGFNSVDASNRFLVPMSAEVFQAVPGAAWSAVTLMAGAIVGTLAALVLCARYVPARRR